MPAVFSPIWIGVKTDDHTEANGIRISIGGGGDVQARLSLRGKLNKGKQYIFEPFVEANWIHNTHDFGTMMNVVRVSLADARNLGEVKVDVESRLSNYLDAWGNVGLQMGDKDYSNSSVAMS
ncbi:autotransporter outer membrane beta-barrel domain-containing protein [Enterobacteriaceae bacterium BIT-l23]|uniref:autotransporter outer membrane beta-barrel domain-containing protein n=1 Tax=Jejubacter sp. L23 TaxID=3092086 RepID=UPI001585B6E5|nr:autotransporter outer membrane beta-barrel domain-containing protein [Enterobacteriaceae bacterium BIT-l23]